MAIVYRDGLHTRWFCQRCGCKTDGTIRKFGIKWVNVRKCGHETMAGYIMPPDVALRRGIAKSNQDMPPDPRIEANKKHISEDKAVQMQELTDFFKRTQTHTNQKFF